MVELPHVVRWYWLIGSSAALVAGIVGGGASARSALWGVIAVALPATLFALWLVVRSRACGTVGGAAFLVGEALKVGATVGLVWSAVRAEPDLQWAPFLLGVALTAKAGWIGLFLMFGRNHGSFRCRTNSV